MEELDPELVGEIDGAMERVPELTVAEAERRLVNRSWSLVRLVLLGAPEIIRENGRRLVRNAAVDLVNASLHD